MMPDLILLPLQPHEDKFNILTFCFVLDKFKLFFTKIFAVLFLI